MSDNNIVIDDDALSNLSPGAIINIVGKTNNEGKVCVYVAYHNQKRVARSIELGDLQNYFNGREFNTNYDGVFGRADEMDIIE